MKNKFLKLFCIFLSLIILITSFTGCVVQQSSNVKDSSPKTSADTKSDAASEEDEVLNEIPLPIVKEPLTLKFWTPFIASMPEHIKTLADTKTYQELMRRTGITIVFEHPPLGQESEQLNLMIASNMLPDVIINSVPGGPEKAINDNIIIPLNDVIAKYAPNLRRVLAKYPHINKMVMTDSGKYYCFPSLRPDPSTLVYMGLIVRKDWLDELGLPIPETMSDWYNMLKEFKEKKNATAPFTIPKNYLTLPSSYFCGAYGVGIGFYVEENRTKVMYGPIQPGFKDFLAELAKWYKEGLLDPDFATNDTKAVDSKVTGGKSGSYFGYSSSITNYKTLVGDTDPKFELIGVPYPVLNRGEIPKFGHYSSEFRDFCSGYVTTANKHVKETAMLLDYYYSEEGNLLMNFGIEGDSYVMIDGYPTYTDKLKNDPRGFSVALTEYVFSGPFVTDPRYFEQTLISKAQGEANNIWAKTKIVEHMLPPVTPSPEDSVRLANIMNEVGTFVNEMILKFIIGQEDINNFDKFVEQLKKMNIEEAIAINQKALDAYNRR